MADITLEFENAIQEAKSLPKRPDDQTLLTLYAYYKQATLGDNQGKRPGLFNPVAQAKYDAWKKLSGVNPTDAMRAYIELVNNLKRS